MIYKKLDKFSFQENKRRYLNLKGIASKRYAYKGPDIVQIDLTESCNSRCLICWINSPFIRKDKDINNERLDYSILKNFIIDIAKSGTKEIIFSGGGEPFAYQQLWEILEFTQKTGLIFRINTNFTLLNRDDIKKLLSFGNLASLTISIWSENAILYSRIHNRDADTLYKVKDNLRFLNELRSPSLEVKIFAVIHNINYQELRGIVDLATELGCNAVEFGVLDSIPKVTDSFLLNDEQLSFLRQDFINMLKELRNKKSKVKIINKNIFLRRISNPGACYGEYDSITDNIPCYAGWFFLRLRANGDFNSCLKSHRLPIGNIYKDNFFSVWNNHLQQEFRKKSLNTHKDEGYFKFIGNGNDGSIGCKRVCDNILMNGHLYRIIKYLFFGLDISQL